MREMIVGFALGVLTCIVKDCIEVVQAGKCVPGEKLDACTYCPRSGLKAYAVKEYPLP